MNTGNMLTDFGGMIEEFTAGAISTTSQIQNCISRGIPIHPRGTGHSCMGQSMRLHNTAVKPELHEITLQGDEVYASSSSTLLDIDNYINQYGYMLPVSPDHRELSLGGVLSVGGYDLESMQNGSLVDHVISLDILTKKGVLQRDSTDNSSLCGIGNHGIILSARLRCIKKSIGIYLVFTRISDIQEYVRHVEQCIQLNSTRQKSTVCCVEWCWDEAWVISTSADNNIGGIWVDDLRTFIQKRNDEWSHKNQFKYHIWSSHLVELNHLPDQLNDSLQLQRLYRSMGVHVIVEAVLIKASRLYEHYPHYSQSEFVVSVSVFCNCTETQHDAAKIVSEIAIASSVRYKHKRDARTYRYGYGVL